MATIRAKSELDSRGFKKGTDKMKGSVKSFQGGLGKLKVAMASAFAVVGIVRSLRALTMFGSTLSDLANQSGLTTDQFQALELASLKAGVSQEKIRTVTSKLAVTLGQAKTGMKTYVDLFDKAGISFKEVQNMDMAGAIQKLSEAFTEAEPGTVEYGAILELLGTRSGAQMKEVLASIAEETLPGLTQKFRESGDVIDSNMIKQLDSAEDSIQLFSRRIKSSAIIALDFLIKKFQETKAVIKGVSSAFAEGFFKAIKGDFKGALDSHLGALNRGAANLSMLQSERKAKQKKDLEEQIAKETKAKETMEKSNARARERIAAEAQAKIDAKAKTEADKKAKEEAKAKEAAVKEADVKADKIAKAKEKFGDITGSGGGAEGDRLSRIGGTIGGQTSGRMTIERAMLDLTKKQNDFIEKLPPEIGKEISRQMFLP